MNELGFGWIAIAVVVALYLLIFKARGSNDG